MAITSEVNLVVDLWNGSAALLSYDLWGRATVPEINYEHGRLSDGALLGKGVIDFDESAQARLQAALDNCLAGADGDPWSEGRMDVTDFDRAILREVECRKKDIEW